MRSLLLVKETKYIKVKMNDNEYSKCSAGEGQKDKLGEQIKNSWIAHIYEKKAFAD